jgi:hypothetical protein
MQIDTAFDFRSDAGGKDPDTYSPTLRRYHQFLWSRALPNGQLFDLSTTTPGVYLHHRSELGEFFLASDSVIHSYRQWKSTQSLIEKIPSYELDDFQASGYTIGGMMVFPGNRVDGKLTINGARGFIRAIADRMDLTLECIRRHYLGLDSPLAVTLHRYVDFFGLFGDFRGYVSHFLLEDLVADGSEVKFFMPFDDFQTPSVPRDVATYQEYRRRSLDFIGSRNIRITQLAAGLSLE